MADKSIKIKIDSALNAGGFKQAEAELGKLAKSVKSASTFIKNIGAAIALAPAAFKRGWDFGKWLSDKFVMPFMKAKGKVDDVISSSEKFIDTISKASADNITKIADEYKSISESAKNAAESRQRELRLMGEQLKMLHEAQDVELEISKQRKLAALAPDDVQGRAKIEADYSQMSGVRDATRSQEAAVLRRQELEAEAKAANDTADKIQSLIKKMEGQLARTKARAATLGALSTQSNEKDISMWRFFGKNRTEEGDALREKQKQGSADAYKEAAKLQADILAKQAEVDKLRATADNATKLRAALFKQIETSEKRIELEKIKGAAAAKKIEEQGIKEAETASKDLAKKEAKAELEARRDTLKKTHAERLRQLDDEKQRLISIVDAARERGYGNVMATAGGGYHGNGTLDQAGETRNNRQSAIDEARAAQAEQQLQEKMKRKGATLDDPSKLGRMSNLERAAFERMKMKEAEKGADKLQKERDEIEKQMAKNIDEINSKLKDVGL